MVIFLLLVLFATIVLIYLTILLILLLYALYSYIFLTILFVYFLFRGCYHHAHLPQKAYQKLVFPHVYI